MASPHRKKSTQALKDREPVVKGISSAKAS